MYSVYCNIPIAVIIGILHFRTLHIRYILILKTDKNKRERKEREDKAEQEKEGKICCYLYCRSFSFLKCQIQGASEKHLLWLTVCGSAVKCL